TTSQNCNSYVSFIALSRSYVMPHVITNVDAKWPGSVHDSRIYRESTLSNRLECGEIDGFLLGEKGYPCKPTLMTPYPEPEPGPQQCFNVAHCRTRARVEMTIGLLKTRFQCLRHLRVTPEKACDIIVACVVLHNGGIGGSVVGFSPIMRKAR
ncbi:hypothetical protein QTP70_022590, partial [Hemibagrus guttatus]